MNLINLLYLCTLNALVKDIKWPLVDNSKQWQCGPQPFLWIPPTVWYLCTIYLQYITQCDTSVYLKQIYSYVSHNTLLDLKKKMLYRMPAKGRPSYWLSKVREAYRSYAYLLWFPQMCSSFLGDTIKIFLQDTLDFILCVVLDLEERVCGCSSDHGRQHWRVRDEKYPCIWVNHKTCQNQGHIWCARES